MHWAQNQPWWEPAPKGPRPPRGPPLWYVEPDPRSPRGPPPAAHDVFGDGDGDSVSQCFAIALVIARIYSQGTQSVRMHV